jgi:hypothetical protein
VRGLGAEGLSVDAAGEVDARGDEVVKGLLDGLSVDAGTVGEAGNRSLTGEGLSVEGLLIAAGAGTARGVTAAGAGAAGLGATGLGASGLGAAGLGAAGFGAAGFGAAAGTLATAGTPGAAITNSSLET